MLPELILPGSGWPPDPLASAPFYRGVVLRRAFAYLLDVLILAAITVALHTLLAMLTILSLGLLWPLHLIFVPLALALAYHTLLIAGPESATLGMRAFGLRVYSMDGIRPSLIQAFVQTVCFYACLGFSGGILLLICLFNRHRRTLHDFLAGTIVLRNISV